jgi:TonB family protein
MANRDSGFITTGERVRSFLLWAFAISILIHLIVGSFAPKLNQQNEQQEVEKVSVTHKIRVRVPTPPPPTPTPPPTPPPKSTPPPKPQPKVEQPKLKVNLVHTTSHSASGPSEATHAQPSSGTENGNPQGQGTSSPAPVSTAPPGTPKPSCANPNVDATVTNAVQPDYPDSARDLGLGAVTVEVEVTVGLTGNLVSATVYKSSSNMAIDQAALRAARESTYAPKMVDCQPTQGDYLFTADFQPDS